MRRAFGTAILVLITATAAFTSPGFADRFNVVQMDSRNHRVFIAPASDIIVSRETTKAFITSISSEINRLYPEWGSQWVASFFTEPQFATYKDDERVLEAVKNGIWSKAYLAEYEHEKRKITITPLDPDKVKWYTVE